MHCPLAGGHPLLPVRLRMRRGPDNLDLSKSGDENGYRERRENIGKGENKRMDWLNFIKCPHTKQCTVSYSFFR